VKTIRVYGTQEQIDALDDSVDIPVDVSDVTESTKKSVNLADALGIK
jgi:YbbR-like protein.